MNDNTVNFETAKDTPLASTYTLWHTEYNGTITNTTGIELDGEETVTTSCPGCGAVIQMPLLEFCQLMAGGDFDLYGSSLYCEKCSAEVRKGK